MANKEHVAILKDGVREWNEWRKENRWVKVDFTEANLNGLRLHKVNLAHVDLRTAELERVDLTWADLMGANLEGAVLHYSNLHHAYLSEARMGGASLMFADMSNADLTDADLRKADLRGANLSGVELQATRFDGAFFSHTRLGSMDLTEAYGLDVAVHEGPSTIGIDTIYESKGNIPVVFLRGAGVPEPFIANMKLLVAEMELIQLPSCFISYSTKDKEFAGRLHTDLRSRNVQCWFAPEDMKIGDRIRPRIDEEILQHDKLLLVLTEDSVKSAWVEKEVETAFDKERKQGRTVLFPIRLDNAAMETERAWAADIRRTRHIGDFSGWKDYDTYKKALERLMRDLADGHA